MTIKTNKNIDILWNIIMIFDNKNSPIYRINKN